MSELDKFKRRTIRSVARLLLKEKKPPEELWREMKKETGTDCRVLWERMRALCVKKLNRMIAVDDRSASLPGIARLSLTDWLLVDLVLVHEKIDVIGMEKQEGKESAALVELFNLVQRFDVEGRTGESLAECWAAATVYYNRQGRQCSPMLLQRRWYQLKKLTRCRFYKFWFSYKGNFRLLTEARKSMPTRLQMAIAKRYPMVITGEFPDWEQQIQKGLIIMPEEFEAKMRMPNLPKPCNSNDPDLVLVEPVIETIDLRIDSDPEDHHNDHMDDPSDPEASNDATDITNPTIQDRCTEHNEALGVKIKTEPVEEDGLSNVQLISATHVPEVEIPDDGPEESPSPEIPSDKNGEVTQENLVENNPNMDDDDVIVIPSVPPTVDLDVELPIDDIPNKAATEDLTKDLSVPSDVVPINDVDDVVDDIIKIKADEFCRKTTENDPDENAVALSVDNLIKDKIDSFLKTPKEDDKKPDVTTLDLTKNKALEETTVDLMADLNFVDDGIEFVDDGVEFMEEDDVQKSESTEPKSPGDHGNENAEEINKFDLKLLMDPVVYTTKLDQMKIFTKKSFSTVVNKEDIEMAAIESKPVSKKSFTMNIKQESVTSIDDARNNDDNSENGDDMYDEMIPIVSHNSYMLKKPKTRSYDPIKLCKNPDFNTKLKRLTIGFLSSTRNRQLLNACIPMTIDLSKAFESKLVNSTLYLKSSGVPLNTVKEEVIDNQANSIVPTAMPVQSLIDNSKTDIKTLISNQSPLTTNPIIAERKKVNLPDIDKVRRLNQQLLTAQVPPLRVYSGNSIRSQPLQAQVPTAVEGVVPNAVEVVKKPTPEVHSGVTEPAPLPTIVSVESTSDTVLATQSTVKVENGNVELKQLPETEPIESLPPAKQKLLKMINQAKISTQEALAKIDSGITEFPKPIVVNKVKTLKNAMPQEVPKRNTAPYRSQATGTRVAWAPRYAQLTEKLDDFLLTNDTLNKMLHLMMSGEKDIRDCNCCAMKPTKKPVKRKWPNTEKKQDASNNSKSEQTNKRPAPPPKDKVNPENSSSASESTTKKPIAQGRVIKYCCWASQKLCNRKRITKHLCLPEECKCCCREKLAQKLLDDEEKRKKEFELRMENKREIFIMKNAIESIENVVQQSREISGTPNIVVSTSARIDVDSIPDPSQNLKKVYVTVNSRPPNHQMSTSPSKTPTVITRITPTPANYGLAKHRLEPRLEPRFSQMNVQRKPEPSSQSSWMPCSCQTPALSQDSQRNIVIDASRNCALHPTPIAPKQDKVLYLHSKSIAKSPSENPIFLGKNKILLTTVKFPPKNDEIVEKEVLQTPKIIPTLPLPAGVQLVLMPSGVVTYSLDPGVELDEAQLATLPTIIAAVQQQLNVEAPALSTPIVDPQVNATEDNLQPVVTPQPEMNISENTELPQTENNLASASAEQEPGDGITTTTELTPPVSLETDEVFEDEELPSKVSGKEDSQVDAPEIMNIDVAAEHSTVASATEQVSVPSAKDSINNGTVEPEFPKDTALDGAPSVSNSTPPVGEPEVVQTETQNETVVETKTDELDSTHETNKANDNEGINSRKSLLSDLMEMSGISAEDTTALPEPVAPEPLPPPPLAQLPTLSNINMISTEKSRNLPELSPVTSFAELKYACEQNGKFFKLDFETGVIVPINVCIKKNAKKKIAPATKEFIDLTDDTAETKHITALGETQILPPGSSTVNAPVSQYLYKGQTLNISNTVKPVKLFKAFRHTPTVLKQPTRSDIPGSPVSRRQTHIEKRKQNFNKIEAKIDLVDSDEPMEEEYLMDTSDDDSQTGTEPMLVEALDPSLYDDDSDSSDDEPLAKKLKRLKKDRHDVRETNIFDEIPEAPEHRSIVSVVSVRKDLSISIGKPFDERSESEPVPLPRILNGPSSSSVMDDLVPSDLGLTDEEGRQELEDIDKDPQELRLFSVSDSEGDGEGEEDCILGV